MTKKGTSFPIKKCRVTMTQNDAYIGNDLQLQNHPLTFVHKKNPFFQIGTSFWSENDSNYLDLKLKVFKKDDKKDFRLVQNLTMGETEFRQFMRLRNQLVIAAENFARAENLSPVLILTLSRDMDEQFKLAHKMVDVVDLAKRKTCSNLLQYRVDKPKNSYAQVLLYAG